MPLVSAVIPTFNRLPYLRRALRSVLAQTRAVDEIIVVDDGSTDGTADTVRREFGDRVRLVVQTNQGVSRARLAGVTAAKGDWIAFLDSDDEWTSDRQGILCSAAEALPADVAWLFGDTLVETGRGEYRFFEKYGLRVRGALDVYDDPMGTQYPIQFSLMPSSMIRRSVLMEVGAFTQNLRSSEDLLAGWQVAARYRMAVVPGVVTRVHREAELAASSMDRVGQQSPDYHRARVIGYSLLVKSGRPGPWHVHHSESVRRLCLRLADEGSPVEGGRRLAFQQFRHGVSGRAMLFMGAAILGKPGLRAWKWVTERRDRILPPKPVVPPLLTHEDSKPQASNVGHD